MKKTLTINLNGRVFNIDEDAYELLNSYLSNLIDYFRKEEGASEIIADFEARIEELFSERIRLGYQVISIEQVEEVIARVGKPDEFGDQEVSDGGTPKAEAGAAADPSAAAATSDDEQKPKRKLFRNPEDVVISGVSSGIAAYIAWDAIAVRLIFVVLAVLTYGIFILVYILLWIFVPMARTARQKLQMKGMPITVENIGKAVSEESEATAAAAPAPNPPVKTGDSCLGGCLKGGLIGCGCLISIPVLFSLGIALIVIVATLMGLPLGFISSLSPWTDEFVISHNGFPPVFAAIAWTLLVGISLLLIIRAVMVHRKKLKPLRVWSKVVWTILLIISLVMVAVSGIQIGSYRIVSNSYPEQVKIGNGIQDEWEISLSESYDKIRLATPLASSVQLEQTTEGPTRILISGEENLIRLIRAQHDTPELRIAVVHNYILRPTTPLIIRIQTPNIEQLNVSGNAVTIPYRLDSERLEILFDGHSSILADSLYVNDMRMIVNGTAKEVRLAGETQKAYFQINGAGDIDASNLESEEVEVAINGGGNVKCDPVEFLKTSIKGAGTVRYKNEPRRRQIETMGIGTVEQLR